MVICVEHLVREAAKKNSSYMAKGKKKSYFFNKLFLAASISCFYITIVKISEQIVLFFFLQSKIVQSLIPLQQLFASRLLKA